MTQTDYNQKKRECWEEFCRANPSHNKSIFARKVFDYAFDRAYALGKVKDLISQDEIGKAAEDYVSFEKGGKCYPSYVVERACCCAFKDGANFALGKQSAEGEEMLTVSRKKVQETWQRAYEQEDQYSRAERKSIIYAVLYYNRGIMSILDTLFGSKCLPDAPSSVPRTKSDVLSSEPKPAEPKFKRCKKVITPSGEVCIIEDTHFENGDWLYLVGDPAQWISESDLELYTEPEESNYSEKLNSSTHFPTPTKQFDNILKDRFRNHNRLHIAAMAMQGILSNADMLQYAINNFPLPAGTRNRYYAVAQLALTHADALIAEAEKGDVQ